MAANDQQRIEGMENTGVEFVPGCVQLVNAFPFATGRNIPYSNHIITERSQKFSRQIPAHRSDKIIMALKWSTRTRLVNNQWSRVSLRGGGEKKRERWHQWINSRSF